MLIASLAEAALPMAMPKGVPDPVAYYALDEASGYDLTEAVTGNTKGGKIIYVEDYQNSTGALKPTDAKHTPNWMTDVNFGKVIACGRKDIEQKDSISLSDVDYGKNGGWTSNSWFKHDGENFKSYQREQYYGHGDGGRSTGSRNQVHLQMEKDGTILAIIMDGTDIDRYNCEFCKGRWLDLDATIGKHCNIRTECRAGISASAETLPAEHGAIDNGDMWHMLTVVGGHPKGAKCGHDSNADTAGRGAHSMWKDHPAIGDCKDGRGYAVYLDGQLRASMPYQGQGHIRYHGDTSKEVPYNNPGVDCNPGKSCKKNKDADDSKIVNGSYPTSETSCTVPLPVAKASTWPGCTGTMEMPWDGKPNQTVYGGRPMDPPGDMRYCGRLGAGNIESATTWNARRYFNGKVAHLGWWDQAMSKEQINALMSAYQVKYKLPSYVFDYQLQAVITMTGYEITNSNADGSKVKASLSAIMSQAATPFVVTADKVAISDNTYNATSKKAAFTATVSGVPTIAVAHKIDIAIDIAIEDILNGFKTAGLTAATDLSFAVADDDHVQSNNENPCENEGCPFKYLWAHISKGPVPTVIKEAVNPNTITDSPAPTFQAAVSALAGAAVLLAMMI